MHIRNVFLPGLSSSLCVLGCEMDGLHSVLLLAIVCCNVFLAGECPFINGHDFIGQGLSKFTDFIGLF